MKAQVEGTRAGLCVLLELALLLYRESPNKEKILSDFQAATEAFGTGNLYSTEPEEFVRTYESYRNDVVRLLKMQQQRASERPKD